MIKRVFDLLFKKDNWKNTCRSAALLICSILYIFCDEHTDKIITVVITILTIDSFSRPKK